MDSTTKLNNLLSKTQSNGGSTVIPGVSPDNTAKLDAIFNQVKTPTTTPTVTPEKKSVGGFAKNVVSSGADLIGGIVSALTHPGQTVKNIGGLALGAGQKLVGYDGEQAGKVDQLVNFYKQRYGKDLGETLYTDPVGVLADISTLLGGGGALLKGVGKVSELSDIAKVSGATNNALRYGKLADKAAVITDPLRLAGKATSFLSKESGLTPALVKAKEFTSKLFKGSEEVKPVAGATKGVRGYIENKATDINIDQPTQTILKKALPGEKPAQTAARVEKEYQKYYDVEEKYKLDPRADTALEVVGTEIGNAYKDVIKKQQDLGKMIGAAKKASTSLVDVAPARETLISQLADAGITKTAKGYKVGKNGTPLAPHDIAMLKEADTGLAKLAKNPTAEAISNFKTQLSAKVDFAKGQNALYKPTNAERIIGQMYHSLDEGLNVKTSPDLQGIYALNKEYSRLQNILKGGDKILGKKTLSGDFTHDAGLAKASIKSLHAGGKKDFLKALGAETGNDFIQNAMIAAQAMKDAGNFKQASLLEELASGLMGSNDQIRLNVGTGGLRPTAIFREGIDKIIGGGIKKVAGTPKETTIRYIKGDTATKTAKAVEKTAVRKPTLAGKAIRYIKEQTGFSTKPGSSQIRTRNAVLRKALNNDQEQ